MKRAQGGMSGPRTGKKPTRAALPWTLVTAATIAVLVGCLPTQFRKDADRVAYDIIARKQAEALEHTEPFTIETPADTLRRRLLLDQQLPYAAPASLNTKDIDPIKQWPDADYLARSAEPDAWVDSFATNRPLLVTLTDALQIAAHGSRDYQSQKEAVFVAALQLDLERDAFRRTWSGVLSTLFQSNLEQEVAIDDKGHTDKQPVNGLEYGGKAGLTQQLHNGLSATGAIGLDLVSLLTQDHLFSRGVYADVSATLPLMRGAGEFVVTEPLTQAERNVVYAIYTFEQFKHTFAVDVADEYLNVLQQLDQVTNAEENYRSLITSTRRAQRLAQAGSMSQIQVDQSRQDELRARQRWVAAQESYQRRLDSFKLTLGLPPESLIELDRTELTTLAERGVAAFPPAELPDDQAPAPAADAPIELTPPGAGPTGPYELDAKEAVLIALQNRLDLRVTVGRVFDAQRAVAVAADQLRADVTLLGTGTAGARRTLAGVSQDDAILRPDEGSYSALLTIDLPLERTAERNIYRSQLIELEQTVRALQEMEDQVKLAVRNRLSELLEARESVAIQIAALTVAKRRVASTNLSIEAGRVDMRDVLEAQDALISAQNALTTALVSYRMGELALQRDLGVLQVNEKGLWQEYSPEQKSD